MIIEEFDYRHYLVRFRVPFITSQGLEQYRRGVIIRITTADGVSGYGEAAALPTFGSGRLEEIEAKLNELGPHLPGSSIEAGQALLASHAEETTTAPARFAIDTALLDLQSRAVGLSLSQYIRAGSAISVPLNATISDLDADGAATAAYYAVTAGYTAIKMKIGVASDLPEELRRVSAVREAIGSAMELRLDVNGSWTFERAIEFSRALAPYDIAYLEQPLPAIDFGAMAKLREQIDIPIAADEAATTRPAVEELIRLNAADMIIIKPAIVGGLTAARALIDLAESHGMRIVVTTALETGVAITAALHLASTLPEPIPPCGLATGLLLESDLLVESPEISGGRMRVPEAPGLGVEPVGSLWA